MLRSVYLFSQGGPMSKLDPANRTIFAATLTSQLGCVRRADQLRSQKLVHRQCQPNNFLGPTPGLMVLHLQLSNKGKHNKFGRSDIMGYISHIDALRDPSAQNGMMLLHRYFALGRSYHPLIVVRCTLCQPTPQCGIVDAFLTNNTVEIGKLP